MLERSPTIIDFRRKVARLVFIPSYYPQPRNIIPSFPNHFFIKSHSINKRGQIQTSPNNARDPTRFLQTTMPLTLITASGQPTETVTDHLILDQ